MPQHFLLTSAARTLSLASVARMSDEEAEAVFRKIRWASNGGEPFLFCFADLEIRRKLLRGADKRSHR